MRYSIILNAKGEEICRTPLKPSEKPLCGFQKGKNGNFFKILDDPRCISDQEAKIEAWKAEQKEFEETHGVREISRLRFGLWNTKVFKAKTKISLAKIQKYIDKYVLGLDNGKVIFDQPEIVQKIDYPGLDRFEYYRKIVVDKVDKNIAIWCDSIDKNPDMVILEALE